MRFGIFGNAKIAREQLIPAILEAGHEVVAIGTRRASEQVSSYEHAGAHAQKIPFCSYEELLTHPGIDALYNPLPNDLHVPWSIRAMAHGKHVLCEKPIALSMEELQHLQDAAQQHQRYVYEAFMVRHHPQWIWLKALDLGPLRSILVSFSYFNRDPQNIRNKAVHGGGALWDIGCYGVNAGHWLFGGEPLQVHASMDIDPDFHVDRQTSALLDWGNGRHLVMSVSTQSTHGQRVRVVGEKGWAEIEIPFNAPPVTKAIWCMQGGEVHTQVFERSNQYANMVSDFVQSCEAQKPADLSSSFAITRTLLRIFESGASQ
jgi:predicted dehydrogenase